MPGSGRRTPPGPIQRGTAFQHRRRVRQASPLARLGIRSKRAICPRHSRSLASTRLSVDRATDSLWGKFKKMDTILISQLIGLSVGLTEEVIGMGEENRKKLLAHAGRAAESLRETRST